jgi:hypothetical protein
MTAVLRSSENPRLILLVSLVDHIEVAVGASFEGIVKTSSTSLSSICAGRATKGPVVRAVYMTPGSIQRRHGNQHTQ